MRAEKSEQQERRAAPPRMCQRIISGSSAPSVLRLRALGAPSAVASDPLPTKRECVSAPTCSFGTCT